MLVPKASIKDIRVWCNHDKLVDIDKLIPFPRNPNIHPQHQIEMLAKIIKNQGWRTPITVSNRSGFVVRGHGRLMAAKHLGLPQVPVDYQDYESEAAEWADLIADNKIGEFASMDDAILRDLMNDIKLADFDMDLTGFDCEELQDFFQGGETSGESGTGDPDAVPDPPAEPKSKLGDLYQLGRHRLLCGDSTNMEDVERLMGEEKADMVFTDPPYNVNYEDTFGRKIKNDNLKDFPGFLKGVYDSMFLVLKDNSPAYVCYAERTVLEFRTVAVESGFEWRNTLIWLKDVPAMNFGHYTWIYEPILYLAKGSPQFYGKPNHPNLLEAASTNSFAGRFDDKGNKATRALHPNQKPTKIIITPIENSSKPGNLLFEPFGGSGSTLIACEKTDRRCFAMEIDPAYIDVIITRWEQFTGQQAAKL